ncbi:MULTISPECIES: hypothetical protein [Methylobacterium]|nr:MULTISPECIES: hypothetical protein [Methylobacterium]MDR7037703.1 hypothetical protein [Methylobacterium sp. BE186]
MSAAPPRGKAWRLLWFVAFYAASLLVFTGLVYFLRAIVRG